LVSGSSTKLEASNGWQNTSNPCAGILDFNDSSAFGAVQAQNAGASLQLYPGGDASDGLAVNQVTNTIFYDQTFSFTYSGGSVCLSSRANTCAPAAVDDAIRFYVDGTEVFYKESYTKDFGPIDLTSKLWNGNNRVRVQLIDLMGPNRGGGALWLVTSGVIGGGSPATNQDANCGSAANDTADNANFCGGPTGLYLWGMPDSNSLRSGALSEEDRFTGDSVCNEGYKWFRVATSNGDTAWAADSGSAPCTIGNQGTSQGSSPQGQGSWQITGAPCPGFDMGADHSIVAMVDGESWMYASPSFSAQRLRATPKNTSMILDAVTCSEGFTWEHQIESDNRSITGWVAVYQGSQPPLPGADTSSATPTIVPVPTVTTSTGLPPDGPRSPSGFWCFIPGFCVQGAEANTTCHPQCVETANNLRPDLPIWGSKWTSDKILAAAQTQPTFTYQGIPQRVRVRGADENPRAGDLVIWPSNCDNAWSGGGHIGYVANDDPFTITDSNWGTPTSNTVCSSRTAAQIPLQSCMRFITSPYPPGQPDFNYKLNPDFTDHSGDSGSGTRAGGGIFGWLQGLFGGK
jgi:hypothetical protein